MTTTLLARLDSDGDVLLAGPAVRAVAASGDRVVLLVGPAGAAAARLLPGVDEVVVWTCPWVVADPSPVSPADVDQVVGRLRALGVDRALVLTSFHQSPLPTALVLRLAGVPWVGAVSEDYPGSLLDLRHRLPETGLHEAQRQLQLAEAAGYALPGDDDGGLAVARPLPDTRLLTGDEPYVVVHPGASVPARAPSPGWAAELVDALADAGHRVVVTGGPGETALSRAVAGTRALDLGGRTSLAELVDALADAGHRVVVTGGPGETALSRAVAGTRALDLGGRTSLAELADVLDRAQCTVVGNTGPAHLSAAVRTPVVSLFAPVVPAERWRPWGVPHALLGDQSSACALTRARTCPVAGHPCLTSVPVCEALAAVQALTTAALQRRVTAAEPPSVMEVSA